jgi:hypothetical protein
MLVRAGERYDVGSANGRTSGTEGLSTWAPPPPGRRGVARGRWRCPSRRSPMTTAPPGSPRTAQTRPSPTPRTCRKRLRSLSEYVELPHGHFPSPREVRARCRESLGSYPEFSGKHVLSSAAIMASGTAHTSGSTRKPSSASRGPPARTDSCQPPPLGVRGVRASHPHAFAVSAAPLRAHTQQTTLEPRWVFTSMPNGPPDTS